MKTKPTVLLLHFFGGSGNTWMELVPMLAEYGFTCLTPDLRGFGDSRMVGDFSFAANVRDVRAICDSLGDEEVIIIGHSMGGKVALAVASDKAENVVGLVLIAPSPPTPEPMSEGERMRLLVGSGDRHAAEKTLAQITSAPLSPLLRERFLRDSVRVKPAAWREWLEAGTRQDISPQLNTVAVPTLILVGEGDKGITRELMESEVLPHLSKTTMVSVPNAAHLLPLEQPQAVADQISDWWAGGVNEPVALP
ncbi:MAG: alpha/beta hydrolase [Akkermansiaceae bacterium]|nr:alpha/beta hydrolase [Armatimonadota bacterium]